MLAVAAHVIGPSKLGTNRAEIQYNKVVCMIAVTRQNSQLDREGNCLKADDHSEPQVHGASIRVIRRRGWALCGSREG